MTVGPQLDSVRSFVRNLNVVVKQVNLYGLTHKQVGPQLESTWKELQHSLANDKLVLTAAGEHLLFNAKPLQAGSADKNLATLLVNAGVAGICFLPQMNPDALTSLVKLLATTKPPDLLAEFRRQFGTNSSVRLLEFHIGGEEPVNAGMNLTGALASAMLNNLKGSVAAASENARPASTNDLLRLLCSFDPKQSSSEEAGAANESDSVSNLAEDDVTETIRWLARLSAGQKGAKDAGLPQAQELPAAGLQALRHALESEDTQPQESDRPTLLSLAEQLAVKVALDKYQRGEIPFNAVQEMLQRLKKEIETLHKVLKGHEDTMYRAGLTVESESEVLDRQFWAAIPARNKLQVLLSSEAWCIPPKNVLSFVGELFDQNDPASEQVLRNYCAILKTGDDNAKLKIAAGLPILASAFTRVSVRLARWAMSFVSTVLGENLSSDLTPALCTALAALVHECAKAGKYEIVPPFFDTLTELRGLAPQISDRVHIEAGVESCASRFVDDALASDLPASDLVEALQQMPYAVAGELKKRAVNCSRRDEYRKLTGLTDQLGEPVIEALRHSATADQASEALPAIGLLTPLDRQHVERTLKNRLQGWSPFQQSVAIHQISCSGMTERGVLLSQLLDCFDELILPQAIDEIGMSGTARVERLVHEASRTESSAPYVQLKVLEALGNLKAKDAVALLKEIVLARSIWKWEFARETRIVALQALLKIDPPTAKNVMKSSGISMEELQLSQLKPATNDWIRQRKYLRVPIAGDMFASITSTSGSCDIAVQALSLGGGGGSTTVKSQLAPDGEVELKLGLRKLRARVLLHAIDTYTVGFEIASIPLEDRTRLRQYLTARRQR